MFSRACPVCRADVLLLTEHMAWHLLEGHDISIEHQMKVKETSDQLVMEAQRQFEEKSKESKPGE